MDVEWSASHTGHIASREKNLWYHWTGGTVNPKTSGTYWTRDMANPKTSGTHWMEAQSTPKPIWTFPRREKPLYPARNQTPWSSSQYNRLDARVSIIHNCRMQLHLQWDNGDQCFHAINAKIINFENTAPWEESSSTSVSQLRFTATLDIMFC